MILKRPDRFEIRWGSSLGSWGGKAFNGTCESQQVVSTGSKQEAFVPWGPQSCWCLKKKLDKDLEVLLNPKDYRRTQL